MKNKIKLNKQYGLVSKTVLQNKKISIKAKGLYVYLSARAGNKFKCNPTVSTICKDLGITDTSFYIYKNELEAAGAITIIKIGKGINKRNEYHLNKVTKGYGIVYLDVLTNKEIKLQSKAIYGLISCYAGTRFIAYPLSKLIYTYLNISRNTHFRLLKGLKEKGIVKTKQLHIDGRYSYCNYYINGATPNNAKNRYIIKFKGKRNKNTKNTKIQKSNYTNYRKMVLNNISYKSLQGYYANNNKALSLLNDIVDILTNTLYEGGKPLLFKGIEMQNNVLQSIYGKLEFKNIKSVIDSVLNVTNKINNKTEYLRVSLANSYYN